MKSHPAVRPDDRRVLRARARRAACKAIHDLLDDAGSAEHMPGWVFDDPELAEVFHQEWRLIVLLLERRARP
jgi:hypothetical protein